MRKISELVTYEYDNEKERLAHEIKMIKNGYKYNDDWLNNQEKHTVNYEKEF
jgi:hypothetical protein